EGEGVDGAYRLGRQEFVAAAGIARRDQRKTATPGKTVLGHFMGLALDGDAVAGRLADDRKENRRATGPEGGIAVPQPGAAVAGGERLHLGAERRDLHGDVPVGYADGARHGISSSRPAKRHDGPA